MPEWIAVVLYVIAAFAGLGSAAVGLRKYFTARVAKVLDEVLLPPAMPAVAPKPPQCRDCKNWDHEAGQQMLRRHGAFAVAMSAISPNETFGEKVFETREDGARFVAHIKPVFSPLENRWDYFGGCHVDSNVHHRTDKCGSFEARDVG